MCRLDIQWDRSRSRGSRTDSVMISGMQLFFSGADGKRWSVSYVVSGFWLDGMEFLIPLSVR